MTQDKNSHQNKVRETLDKLYDQEAPFFREYLRRFREDPTSRIFAPVAETYRKMGRLDEAISICRDGLKHHPQFHSARVLLARCLIDKKLIDEAGKELEQVIQAIPDNLLAQRLFAEILEEQGKRKEALHSYKMALLLSPDDISLAEKVHKLEEELFLLEKNKIEISNSLSESSELKNSEAFFISPKDKTSEDDLNELDEIVVSDNITPPTDEEIEFLKEEEPEAFSVQHVSDLFDSEKKNEKEITTETLADLYFNQGQFDEALKIYERLSATSSSPELEKKLNTCRIKLGVDKASLIRKQKIKLLNRILVRVSNYKKLEKLNNK